MTAPEGLAAVHAVTPRRAIAGGVALSWAGALAAAAALVALGHGVDALVAGTDVPTGVWIVAAAGAAIAAACAGVGAWLPQVQAARTEAGLRARVVAAAFADDLAGRPPRAAGEALQAATTSSERAAQYRAGFIGPIAGSLTTPILVLVVMAVWVDAPTAAVLAGLLVIVPIAITLFRRAVRPIGGAYRREQGRLTGRFLESLGALETLVYARAAARRGEELAADGERYRRGLLRLLAGNQLLILVVDALFSLTVLASAAAMAVSRFQDGALTLGGALTILLLAPLVTGPVDIVGQFFYVGIAGRAAEESLAAFGGGSADASGADAFAHMPPEASVDPDVAIALDDATAGWPGGPDVIAGASLEIRRGERVAIVGPSGAGKSTLGALVRGRLLPRAGRVRLAGPRGAVALHAGSGPAEAAAARALYAAVEQKPYLFVGTIGENLRIARPEASDDALWDALRRAGLEDELRALPQGLSTPIGAEGALLSGGQGQRLAIARAWLADAPMLLLDEPTSQVDLAGEARILAALDDLARGRTVLMIAHRPGAILAADRVLHVEAGAVSER